MYRAAIFASSAVSAPNVNGSIKASKYEKVEDAKSAINTFVANNKSSFSNGYTAYVIDQDTDRVVSVATVPEPSLTWTDVK